MNIIGLVAIAGLFYLMLTASVYLGQRSLLYHPDKRLHAAASYGVPQFKDLPAPGDAKLVHWYAKAARGTAPVIVLFHGNGGHIGHRAFKAKILVDAGYGVLLVGYRGYGGNDGSPSEAGLYEDARSALGLLGDRGVENDRTVLYGESLGTGVAVQMATEGHGAALILEAPYNSLIDAAFHHYPVFPVSLLLKDRFQSDQKISDVTIPKLFIHGAKDRVIPIDLGRRLFQRAADPKVWAQIDSAGHNDLYDHGAEPLILDFLERHFPGGVSVK